MNFHYFSKNGELLPVEQAHISLFNVAYSYGFGVYETIKVRNGTPYFVDQHVERLEKSAEIIGLEHPYTQEQIKNFIAALLQKHTHIAAGNIKLLLIGAEQKEDAQLFILLLSPLFPDRKLYTHGATVITAKYQRIFPNAKTLNMLGSYLAYKKAKSQGCYDALLLDEESNILEGTRTNFFAIKNTTIFTPPKEQVLEGVTRATVIAVAKQNGFRVEETAISVKQMETFDGAFLTSTSTKIIPIKQIDDMIFENIPENVKHVMKLYDTFLDTSGGKL